MVYQELDAYGYKMEENLEKFMKSNLVKNLK